MTKTIAARVPTVLMVVASVIPSPVLAAGEFFASGLAGYGIGGNNFAGSGGGYSFESPARPSPHLGAELTYSLLGHEPSRNQLNVGLAIDYHFLTGSPKAGLARLYGAVVEFHPYYLSNLFLNAKIGLAQAVREDISSKTGLGTELSLGYRFNVAPTFWLSPQIGTFSMPFFPGEIDGHASLLTFDVMASFELPSS